MKLETFPRYGAGFAFSITLLPLAIACGNKAPPAPAPVPTASASATVEAPDAAVAMIDAAVAPVDAAPPEPEIAVTVLAKNQHASSAITADGTHVYWVEDIEGTVTRVPKRGGAIMMFYSSSTGGFAAPSTLAIDDKEVFWTEHHKQDGPGGGIMASVMKLEKMGGKPTAVATGIRDELHSLAVDEKNVYWIAGGAIVRASKGGGGVGPITFKLNDPTSVAGDTKYVYWTQSGPADKGKEGGAVLRQAPNPGSKFETLASGVDKPSGIMLADDFVCWISSGTKIACMEKKGGATPKVIGESAGGIADATYDEKFVYWLGNDGTVMRAPRDGASPPEKLASGQANPVGITVDKTNVYWSTKGTEANKFRDGTVVMRPKP